MKSLVFVFAMFFAVNSLANSASLDRVVLQPEATTAFPPAL